MSVEEDIVAEVEVVSSVPIVIWVDVEVVQAADVVPIVVWVQVQTVVVVDPGVLIDMGNFDAIRERRLH